SAARPPAAAPWAAPTSSACPRRRRGSRRAAVRSCGLPCSGASVRLTGILSGWRLLGCVGAGDPRRSLPPTPPCRGPDLGRRAAVRRRLRADADVGAPALRTCSGKPAARGSGGAAGVGAAQVRRVVVGERAAAGVRAGRAGDGGRAADAGGGAA